MYCVLHDVSPEPARSAGAETVILGLAVCGSCLGAIMRNIAAGETYTAEDYLRDAAEGSWI